MQNDEYVYTGKSCSLFRQWEVITQAEQSPYFGTEKFIMQEVANVLCVMGIVFLPSLSKNKNLLAALFRNWQYCLVENTHYKTAYQPIILTSFCFLGH